MHLFETSAGYMVRLDVGEEVMHTLGLFFEQAKLQGAFFSGIGAVKNTTLGYFDLHRRQYSERQFAGDMELLSCTGNLTWVDGGPMIHAHAVISGPDFTAFGGHVFSMEIAVTGEFLVTPTDTALLRAADERTGLNLIAKGKD